MQNINQLNLYKDENHVIYMGKHSHACLVIQVARYGPKQTVGPGGQIIEDRAPYVVWERKIATSKTTQQDKTQFIPVDPNDFKKDVRAAVAEANIVLGKLKEVEDMMTGCLVDYVHSCRQYNEGIPPTGKEIAAMNDQNLKDHPPKNK